MSLRFQFRESPESNDHQTRILIGEDDYLNLCDPSTLGIDPPDFFAQAALRSDGELLVGRCSCGCVGCGDEFVTTSFTPSTVTWTGRRVAPAGMCFALSDYLAEIERAEADTSWETVERCAERLVRHLDFSVLTRQGISFVWSSARLRSDTIAVCLDLDDHGRYQLICSTPWDHCDPADAVAAFQRLLRTEIASWPDVVYYPQVTGLGRPSSAGPLWKPHN
jgi:hypothetical protein